MNKVVKKKKKVLANVCKSCLACKGNTELSERFYKAWFERESGGETLAHIGEEIDISREAIYRHAKNHMVQRANKVYEMEIKDKKASELKLQAMKELEISFDHETAVPKQDFETVIDQVLIDGLAQMKVEGKQITVNQLIAAAKIKGDWQSKKRGQDTEIIKMMYRSASGFNANTNAS
jgi:hypothetical protein